MAERRMFAKTIIDSDTFLDMPLSTQCLYFHLGMRADDDGFINNPKKIQRMTGCGDDDLKLLIAKQFIIPFESGVVVLKHWKVHNYIRSDRYKETMYREEKAMLETAKNKEYMLGIPNDSQVVYQMDTQVRLGKDSIGKNSIGYYKPRLEEITHYCLERHSKVDAKRFFDYYDANDWKDSKGKPITNWKQKLIAWETREDEKHKGFDGKQSKRDGSEYAEYD
jgi:hypothetical protein